MLPLGVDHIIEVEAFRSIAVNAEVAADDI